MRKIYPDLYGIADEIREGLKESSSSSTKSKPSGLMGKKSTEGKQNG